MNPTGLENLTEQVRALPAQDPGRARRLRYLADLHAAAEAAVALHEAAGRAGAHGLPGTVLASARAITEARREPAPHDLTDEARGTLTGVIASPAMSSLAAEWIRELRDTAARRPDTGACTVASALQLWSWTVEHLRHADLGEGRAAASDELVDALCTLVEARCFVQEVARQPRGKAGEPALRADLCHAFTARAAAATGARCAEVVFGYRRHLSWDAEGCGACYGGEEVDGLEALMPGIASAARSAGEVVETDGSHATKAGPCARFDGVETFLGLRQRLDGCLTGARVARDRAAVALGQAATVGTR